MKKQTRKLLIIGILWIVLGFSMAIPARIMGAATGIARTENDLILFGEAYEKRSGNDKNLLQKQQVDSSQIPQFSSLKINLSYTDLVFETASTPGLSLEYYNHTPIEWKVTDGTLEILEKPIRNSGSRHYLSYIDIEGFFGYYNNGYTKTPQVTVYLPQNYQFKELDINNEGGSVQDLGNCKAENTSISISYDTLTLHDLETDTLTIKGNTATSYLSAIKATSITIDNSYSTNTLDDIQAETLQFNGETCDLSFDTITAKDLNVRNTYNTTHFSDVVADNLSFKGNTSQTKLSNSTFISADITNSYGDITANNLTTGLLTIDSNSGTIDLAGLFTGDTKIKSRYADVSLYTTLPKEEFNWELTSQYGSVTVNQEETAAKTSLQTGANNTITIQADNEIALQFDS